MSKSIKFVVIIDQTIQWIENRALNFYSKLLGDIEGKKYAIAHLSKDKILKFQNDFSIEIMMVFDQDVASSFIQLNSSCFYHDSLSKKPLKINHVVFNNLEELVLLFNRLEKVAAQRKHDLIWVQLLEENLILSDFLKSNSYQIFLYDIENQNADSRKHIYFRKELI